MGVEHALDLALHAFAHRVGSYKGKNIHMSDKTWAIQTSSGRINNA